MEVKNSKIKNIYKYYIKNKNFKQIFELFDNINIDINDIDINIIKKILYTYEDKKKLIPYYEELFDKYKHDEAFLTLGMRLYLYINDIETAYKIFIYIKEPKKRNILPIFNHYCLTNDELAFSFYKNNLYNKFLINEDEYIRIINIYKNDYEKLNFIFNDMKNNILNISSKLKDLFTNINKNLQITSINHENNCKNCNDKLKLIDLDKNEKIKLIDNIKLEYFKKYSNELKKFEDFLQNEKIEVFIDAGNIIFYQERRVTYNSFLKIDLIYNSLKKKYRVLVIIHERHFNNLKKSKLTKKQKYKIKEMFKSWNIYQTPYHLNDDWYFIYGSLLKDKSYIVTNDKLRDHQFKISEKNNINNTLAKFIDRFVIRYDFKNMNYDNTNVVLNFPNTYSTEIQKVNNWHFPYNNKWVCFIK
tara:strand:- start:39 stop:1286 length:1248 start_codon:yes stop_codon:yes gene_type:complete